VAVVPLSTIVPSFALAAALTGWLQADRQLRERTRAGLVANGARALVLGGVSPAGVIAAAQGQLDALAKP